MMCYQYLIFVKRSLIAVTLLFVLISCQGETESAQVSLDASCKPAAPNFDASIFEAPGLHFYVTADSGNGFNGQRTAAAVIEAYHQLYPLDAIFHAGDLIYPSGISAVDDPLAELKFESVYSEYQLDGLVWYGIPGNHDYDGSVSALIEYANISPRLHMPSTYYQKDFDAPFNGRGVSLLALDTTPFTEGLSQIRQLAWLQERLSQSNGNLVLIMGHHPIFVNGRDIETPELKQQLEGLLESYNVKLYLAGHTHNLQFLDKSKQTYYMVSGGGGRHLDKLACGEKSLFGRSAHGGFAIYVTAENVWVIPVTEFGAEYMFLLE